MSELCFSSDGASAGSVGLRVTDSSGSVLVSAAADTVFSMPWSRGFAGTYSIMQAPENLRDLCIANSTTMASWAGSVVLSSSFYAPGCSYEKRAELAMQSGAAGLLFNGAMHSIFDWDGGSQADLAPSTVTLGPVYECVAAAVDAAGGAATIELTPGPSPLQATWFIALSWVLNATLLIAELASMCAGLWQSWRFSKYGMEPSTRLVVGMETLSQAFMFIRNLNGPAYELAYQSIMPHYVYRVSFSLFNEIHMLAMLLVSKQLRRTIEQINVMGANEDGNTRSCFKRHIHGFIAALVVIACLYDFAIACLDSTYQSDFSLTVIIYIFNVLFFGSMGYYYYRQGNTILRMLKEASHLGGSNERVTQFSRNIRRVGVLLMLTFLLQLVCWMLVLSLDPNTTLYYVGTSVFFAPAVLTQALQALFVIISYKPNIPDKKGAAKKQMYGSSADLAQWASTGNLRVQVDESRFSGQERASPSPGGCGKWDSSRASHNESASDEAELGRSPSRRPSPLVRSASKLTSSKSFKGFNSLTGASDFNLFDPPPAAEAAGGAAQPPTTPTVAAAPESSGRGSKVRFSEGTASASERGDGGGSPSTPAADAPAADAPPAERV